jgi:predicted DNA-binding protein
MAERDTSIALSDEEKNRLDEVAEDAFGESKTIPYGVTLTYLMDNYQEQ